jgi:hypothetical protein
MPFVTNHDNYKAITSEFVLIIVDVAAFVYAVDDIVDYLTDQ